jgi:hypothetical protein
MMLQGHLRHDTRTTRHFRVHGTQACTFIQSPVVALIYSAPSHTPWDWT